MTVRIHPGIGVARVGDSPEYFVGPETVDLPSTPAGGYRDSEGRIRRQAAQFRLFDDDAPVPLPAGTAIQWTVQLQGGMATITGPNQTVSILVGAQVVAELETDAQSHLRVLSCQIDGASTNGCCDGPVEASVVSSTTTTAAVSSWVTIAPPDFAPGKYPVLPYYLLIWDWLVTEGLLSVPASGTHLSFRRDVYPAIRGRTSLSPAALLALSTTAARIAAVPFYTPALGEPSDIEGPYLHSVVEHFHNGHFDDDWGTPTPTTRAELDRGPLCFVDGSCPGGWELRLLPITGANPFAAGETLRFGPSASPGVTRPFYGWTSDLAACLDMWISVTDSPYPWGADWHLRGFMVQSSGSLVYEDWATRVEVHTSQLHFHQVEAGTALARMFEVELFGFYEETSIEFIAPLPPGIQVLALVNPSGATIENGTTLKLPVLYRAALDATPGPLPPATLEVHIAGSTYFIPITGEIVPASSTQLGLVLDCSYSMGEDRGDGESKFKGLKKAVEVLVGVARPNDGICVAPFSDDALTPRKAHTLGTSVAPGSERDHVKQFVNAMVLENNTSIGDGLLSARSEMALTPDSFDREAIIVITDGKETAPHYIDEVASSIDQHTFAIGIGTQDNVDTDKLDLLTSNTQGYLLLTGNPVSAASQYRLEKYVLQILAGATNEEVVLDPTGSVLSGTVARVPIPVTEAEFRLDVVVVSDDAPRLLLALMGPDGTVRTFDSLAGEPGVQIVRAPRVGMARVSTPLSTLDGHSFGAGTWHLLIAERGSLPPGASLEEGFGTLLSNPTHLLAVSARKSISYAAIVNARSAIRLTAHAAALSGPRSGFEIEATVTYGGVPFKSRAAVVAEVETPTGLSLEVPLEATHPGRYVGHFGAVRPGVYVTRVRARGRSPGGSSFVRELTLTPAISADKRGSGSRSQGSSLTDRLCDCRAELGKIISCLVKGKPRKG